MGAFRFVTTGGRQALGAAAVVAATAVAVSFVVVQQGDVPDAAGRQLYVENCARCHGLNLEGQPNWMKRLPNGRLPAPPHDESGHTWHHSDKQLLELVKEGFASIAPGYETDMPAYSGVLTDEAIIAIVDFIKSTWPERARAYQAARTAADQQ